MKNFLLISLAALIGLTTYGTSFGAGSSDNDDSSSKEVVDVDYLKGKEAVSYTHLTLPTKA